MGATASFRRRLGRAERHALTGTAGTPTAGRGRTRWGKLQIVDSPRQMLVPRAGAVPLAILNGSNDPFLDHADFRDLKLGQLWRDAPHAIPDGFHAPVFLRPEAFNAALGLFLDEAVKTPRRAGPTTGVYQSRPRLRLTPP